MSPGDIHWVELPPANGHEQVGRLAAVVLQDESYAGSLPIVIVIPLNGATATVRFPGTVSLAPTPENGLQKPSIALVFQIRAVDRRRIQTKIGTLDAASLEEIYSALDRLVGRTPGT